MAAITIRFDADACLALEQRYDERLGGADTRPFRELLGYCAGRVLAIGADDETLLEYFTEILAMLRGLPPAAEFQT